MPREAAFLLFLLSGAFLLAAASLWFKVARPSPGGLSFPAVRRAASVSGLALGLLGITLLTMALTEL